LEVVREHYHRYDLKTEEAGPEPEPEKKVVK